MTLSWLAMISSFPARSSSRCASSSLCWATSARARTSSARRSSASARARASSTWRSWASACPLAISAACAKSSTSLWASSAFLMVISASLPASSAWCSAFLVAASASAPAASSPAEGQENLCPVQVFCGLRRGAGSSQAAQLPLAAVPACGTSTPPALSMLAVAGAEAELAAPSCPPGEAAAGAQQLPCGRLRTGVQSIAGCMPPSAAKAGPGAGATLGESNTWAAGWLEPAAPQGNGACGSSHVACAWPLGAQQLPLRNVGEGLGAGRMRAAAGPFGSGV
mmetsp:Transcript_90813/g.282467  ORF Transcript_90813/g.282467 Transcript_90813/m.282467 type:complete len:281 (+) Transcript_90813:417-1259(+)